MKFTFNHYVIIHDLIVMEIRRQELKCKECEDGFISHYPNGEFKGEGEPPLDYISLKIKLSYENDYLQELINIKNEFEQQKF